MSAYETGEAKEPADRASLSCCSDAHEVCSGRVWDKDSTQWKLCTCSCHDQKEK